jgi:hypothetical protein
VQLNVQRRRRPEISTLIRETVYPQLFDHPCIKNLPDAAGMRKNVFWLDHDIFEESHHKSTVQKSHSNLYQIKMIHGLVLHIVCQGFYTSSELALPTPYTGQLQKLRAKLSRDFEIVLSERDQETPEMEGVNAESQSTDDDYRPSRSKPLQKKNLSDHLRIATVGNFQGEEAKIIIISLVRSNKEQKPGSLRTSNRINVLLTRAQDGMYLIGNTDTYRNAEIWAKVIGMLQTTDSVGKTLVLYCPRHKDTEIQVAQPDDFVESVQKAVANCSVIAP